MESVLPQFLSNKHSAPRPTRLSNLLFAGVEVHVSKAAVLLYLDALRLDPSVKGCPSDAQFFRHVVDWLPKFSLSRVHAVSLTVSNSPARQAKCRNCANTRTPRLDRMNSTNSKSTVVNPEFLRASTMAGIVGVPVRSFHLYAAQGLIPSFKLGKHRLFRKAEVFAALEKLRTASVQEVLS